MSNFFSAFSSLQHIPPSYLAQFLPAVPSQFYTSVGSTFVAAAMGGTYGLIGRVIYPNMGISPLHYTVWFALAFQIKQFVCALEDRFGHFLNKRFDLEKLRQSSKDKLSFSDRLCPHYWQLVQCKKDILKTIDGVFCRVLNIRSCDSINSNNVEKASFLEMCRYRMWSVFKSAVLDAVSLTVAYRFSNLMGFTLPSRTSMPLFMMTYSIVRDIILVPALYVYARWYYREGHDVEGGGEAVSNYQKKWIYKLLPSL